MMTGKQKRRWLLFTAALVVPTGAALAEWITPINQVGRIVGAGWGDGYHACESSGFQPCADMPLTSYAAYSAPRRSETMHRAAHQAARTFYDHFDSLRGRLHHQPCDPSCFDECGCDAPGVYIDGSQVIQEPRLSAAHSTTIKPPQPNLAPKSPGLDRAPAVSLLPSTIASTRQLRLPAPHLPAPERATELENELAAEPQPAEPQPAEPQPAAYRLSRTPAPIRPQHPGNDPLDRTERLLRAALGESFRMPTRQSASLATARQPDRLAASYPQSPSPNRLNLRPYLPVPEGPFQATNTPLPIQIRSETGIRYNPLALPRAVVELAGKPPHADSPVVTQPR